MEFEAIYDNGRLELPRHLRLKHQRFRLRVEIPDRELMAEQEANASDPGVGDSDGLEREDLGIRERVATILGQNLEQVRKGRPDSPDDYKAIWREHLKDRYLGEN